MRQLRVSEAIEYSNDPDYFGPQFEAFKPKPKRQLPKSAPHIKAAATEDIDRQIREQIRVKIPLAQIEIMHVTRIPVVLSANITINKKKRALRRPHASLERARKIPEKQADRAGEELVEIKIGLTKLDVASFYDRERQRYLELSAHAQLLKNGKRKARERAEAHFILQGFANGMRHREASIAAGTALLNLMTDINARQLAHVIKIVDRFPMTLDERLAFVRCAPREAFLNRHILQPLLDHVMRDATGAPITNDTQPCNLMRKLPAIAELAMEQQVWGKPDEDCITPGDLRCYIEDLAAHPSVKHMEIYKLMLRGCVKDIQRVPRNLKLRREGKAHIESAFADSARLLAETKQAPAVAAAAPRLVARRPKLKAAQSLAA